MRKDGQVNMLDNKSPRSKLGPASRGCSFYIENLLGTAYRAASSEERVETERLKETDRSPVICPGLETKRLDERGVLTGSGTSPNTAYGSSRSKCIQ